LRCASFHPCVAKQSAEQAITDFSLYEQLANRCAGLIQRDQVSGVRHFSFSGHIYDFQTENGLIAANGIITSNCRCRLISLSERQATRFIEADRKRMQDSEAATARANAKLDKGWDYDICAEPTEGLRRAIEQRRKDCNSIDLAKKRTGISLPCQPAGRDYLAMLEAVATSGGKMPEARRVDVQLLPSGQSERVYLERFMREFDEAFDATAIVEAPTGHPLAVSSELFTDHKTGRSKITKEGRAAYLLYLAETIKNPDEVWMTTGAAGDRSLYYLAWYLIGGKETAMLAVFKERGKVWEGWSGYQSQNMAYIEAKRTGVLLYRGTKR
jgi:hypothetical protein